MKDISYQDTCTGGQRITAATLIRGFLQLFYYGVVYETNGKGQIGIREGQKTW